jgi:hypothetical protein
LFASALEALIAMPIADGCGPGGGRSFSSRRCSAPARPLATSFATGLPPLAAALFAFGAGFGSINVAAAQAPLERVRERRIFRRCMRLSARRSCWSRSGRARLAATIGPQAHFAVVSSSSRA